MKRCDHDRVYSGQINLNRRYAWICLKCGAHDWSEAYVLDQVNLDQYQRLRVLHGWAAPVKLPAPPRVPTNTTPQTAPWWPFAPGALFFAGLSLMCLLAAIPWGALGPIMPLWMALICAGVGLGTSTLLFVCWKQGVQ